MRNKYIFNVKNQANFFDDEKYQYSKHLLANPPYHTKVEINSLLDLLPDLTSKDKVVDFGAGSGRITIPMLMKKINVVSVDVSKSSLLTLLNTAKENKLDGLEVESKIPSDTKYSAIVGADILHHIDLDEYLPVFYKSLKTDGKVIFSEPNAHNPFWYMILPVLSSWEIERGVLNCSRSNLENLFKKYGFRKVNIYGKCVLPGPIFNFSRRACDINDKAGNFPVLKQFAYRLLIEAVK